MERVVATPMLVEAGIINKYYMDQTKLQEKIAFYYSKLPTDVQTVFSSMKWMDILGDISKKYILTNEQIEVLGTETTLVMLGIIDATEYEATIKRDIAIAPAVMEKMMGDIDTLILGAVRSRLEDTYVANIEELVAESEQKEKVTIEEKTLLDDEVPLPPYRDQEIEESLSTTTKETEQASLPTSEQSKIKETVASTPNSESSIYKNIGIEMIDTKDEPTATENFERKDSILKKENTLLTNSGIDILADKLKGISSSSVRMSTYTPTKNGEVQSKDFSLEEPPKAKAHDPYHEVIE